VTSASLKAAWAIPAALLLAAGIVSSCATLKTVVHVAKDQCVVIDQVNNNPELADICATIEDLAPIFEAIAARKRAALARDAGADAPATDAR
jgi:hypothetical protein